MALDLGFRKPVPDNVFAEVMSGWGRPRAGGKEHSGLDILLPIGKPVVAMAAGQVIRVQATDNGGSAGIFIVIRHPSGISSRYIHLGRADVTLNQQVAKGQVIGLSGNTAIKNSPPHMHVDIKVPAELLPQIEAQVGKPPGGWHPLVSPWGYGVPGEPWIPVDRYSARTIEDAQKNGIPLYRGGIAKAAGVAALLLLGWGLYRLTR